ncbi:Hypothetical protein Tpal_2110 [Trichococcus palustris]|uniref:DUF218 domain-containing protein n=1 Tax=Trichococcus palustris TaxID=140314 RepID=A0A143YRF2_9LACT|nr:YdcF family protein [Trichococcus palustris]CZQ97171.1 Hypothetical protein Tpal_2110 [Trichococcus palustris]SFK75653.1 DUF218 domain-containing protein [Trichococcus palustris]
MAKFTFDKEISYFKTDASTRSTMKLLNSILVAMLLFLAVIFYILLHLDVNQSPAVSDIIILPEGGIERPLKAAELLDEGYSLSGKVLITPYDPEEMQLSGEPIFQDEDILPEYRATSTWTNAVNSVAMMEEYGYKTAIVVSSDYHMNRVKFSYDKAAAGKGITFTYVSAGGPEGKPWIETETGRYLAVREIFKTLGYWFGLYHFIDL